MSDDKKPYHETMPELLDALSRTASYEGALRHVLKFVQNTSIPEEHLMTTIPKVSEGAKFLKDKLSDLHENHNKVMDDLNAMKVSVYEQVISAGQQEDQVTGE